MTPQALATLVMGPHRSGTSCVTELVHRAGAAVGRDLLGVHDCNVRGLWENAALVAANEALLSAAGSAWFDHSFCDLAERQVDSRHRYEIFIDMLRAQFADERGGLPPHLVLKDPRACRSAGGLAEALEALNCRVRLLVVLRDPAECADSLYRRDGIPRQVGLGLWLSHMLGSLRCAQSRPARLVDYRRLLSDDAPYLRELLRWLGEGRPAPDALLERARACIAPELRHSRAAGLAALAATPLDALAAELAGALAGPPLSTERLDHFLQAYRRLTVPVGWFSRSRVVVLHQRADEPAADARVLDVAKELGADLLVVRDGGQQGPGAELAAELAGSGRSGVFFNLCERGEAASLVRGVSLAAGRSVVLLTAAGRGALDRFMPQLAQNDADGALWRDTASSRLLAVTLPAGWVAGIDAWAHVPAGEAAIDSMLAALAAEGRRPRRVGAG